MKKSNRSSAKKKATTDQIRAKAKDKPAEKKILEREKVRDADFHHEHSFTNSISK